MRHADVRDDRRVGSGNAGQGRDFAGMIHANFPNSHFILGSRFQNGTRQTNVIVEIAFRLGDAKVSRQNRRGEIFRARLPVASSDRGHF